MPLKRQLCWTTYDIDITFADVILRLDKLCINFLETCISLLEQKENYVCVLIFYSNYQRCHKWHEKIDTVTATTISIKISWCSTLLLSAKLIKPRCVSLPNMPEYFSVCPYHNSLSSLMRFRKLLYHLFCAHYAANNANKLLLMLL